MLWEEIMLTIAGKLPSVPFQIGRNCVGLLSFLNRVTLLENFSNSYRKQWII